MREVCAKNYVIMENTFLVDFSIFFVVAGVILDSIDRLVAFSFSYI